VLAKEEMFADSDLPPRSYQTFPFVGLDLQLPREQHLNPSMKKLPRRRIVRTHRLRSEPAPPSIKPGRKHPSVVEDNQIATPQQFWELTKLPILSSPRGRLQMQQARTCPVCQRFLRDQILG
jgi:hypothetical protein